MPPGVSGALHALLSAGAAACSGAGGAGFRAGLNPGAHRSTGEQRGSLATQRSSRITAARTFPRCSSSRPHACAEVTGAHPLAAAASMLLRCCRSAGLKPARACTACSRVLAVHLWRAW